MKEEATRQLRSYLNNLNWKSEETLSVTLTMKQHSQGEILDEIKASKNLRHFLSRLNRRCFGASARRFGRKVEVIPSLETTRDGRLHYHLAIKIPKSEPKTQFANKIAVCWSETLFADEHIDIQQTHDFSGWNIYITKDRKLNIDWENFHTA